ncbi:hypothetical protein BGZ63DRAFT_395729 [Mariannaea sp. PMI_226]|nr:hypothetical protein BGZ63DRAFT_395729 [Mariannaea sp. PMI_226]
MEHAWLDSLSEDWISQPGSSPSAQLPPLNQGDAPKPKETPSRIPRRTFGHRSQSSNKHDNSVNILNERSTNDVNISRHRLSLRLSQPKQTTRGGAAVGSGASRSVSASTTGSVVHNTTQYKSSPARGKGDTPEWKRRLIYGEVQYGEQRDLFSSAANGLQDMFKPPSASEPPSASFGPGADADGEQHEHETTMPSSPPYPQRIASIDLSSADLDELEDDEPIYPNEVTPSPSPRRSRKEMTYKLNTDESSQLSDPTPSRQPDIYRDESCLSVPDKVNLARKPSAQSGQSVLLNEDFSPILIGRQSGQNGKLGFGPVELPVDQLKSKLESVRISQHLSPPEVDDDEEEDDADDDDTAARGNNSNNTTTNKSKFNNSSNLNSSERFQQAGGYINTRRGGRSADAALQYRPISPGFGVDTSEMLPEESLQASTPKQFPSVRALGANLDDRFSFSPSMPRAPFPSPDKRQIAQRALSGGGSPLKLFGPYDTFTNQTLLRRISQFEEGMSDTTSRQSAASSVIHHDQSSATPPDTRSMPALSSPAKLERTSSVSLDMRSVSQFGAGDLEGYEFSGDVSGSLEDLSASDKENTPPRPPLASHPGSPLFQLPAREPSPDEDSELVVRRRRNKSLSSSATRHGRTFSSSSQVWRQQHHHHHHHHHLSPAKGGPVLAPAPLRDGSEGKRPRTSPSKDPTPKRRRTLHRSDIAFGREDRLAAVDSAHREMQSVMGKKRKDARPGTFQLATANVLAMRSILHPLSPSLSRASSRNHSRNSSLDPEMLMGQFTKRSPIRIHQDDSIVPSSPVTEAAVAAAAAAAADHRKPSIRTQDYLDQAAQIMAMIRNQVESGLTSVEESEAEHGGTGGGIPTPEDDDENNDDNDNDDASSYQESSQEPLSRPPSREGRPMPRLPVRQEDPELIKRLRKYQELSDMGDVISSSMRSVSLAKDAIRAAQEVERQIEEQARRNRDVDIPYTTDDEVISDPPNIRLSTNPARDLPGSPTRDFNSHSSSGTNGSYPTGSSRGSDSRKVIMPESVSHLIPDRVGSMYLDKQNNIWIKKKGTPPQRRSTNIFLPSEDSEDDPFASIPDLSVDLTREMQNLLLTAKKLSPAGAERQTPISPQPRSASSSSKGYLTLSPNGQLSPEVASLARGEFEKLEKLDARAMEEEEEEAAEAAAAAAAAASAAAEVMDGDDDDGQGGEQERPNRPNADGLLDDSIQDESHPSSVKKRNLTITFSSPVASIIQDVVAEDLDSLEDDPVLEHVTQQPTSSKPGHHQPQHPLAATKSALKLGQGSFRSRIASRQSGNKHNGSNSTSTSSSSNGGSNSNSNNIKNHHGPAFIPRPVSRIDEQDEESTIEIPPEDQRQVSIIGETSVVSHHHKTPDGRRGSLSFIVGQTPRTYLSVPDESQIIGQNVGKLSLSPLSEFTLNNSDQSFGFEVSYVMGRHHLATGEGTKKVMSMTIRDLVDRLSEVEPFEPYWEDIAELDLHEKRLGSLHMLDEFCGKLITLDVSKNVLSHLDGVPSTVRQLKASHNMLTELTSWNHLLNLQYIDISGNEVKSLSALKGLVHLRSIKADNNQLTSLDGLDGHDGLLSLRARDNCIQDVDFARFRMERLTELDLTGNQIESVRNLELMPVLARLKLGKNRLMSFAVNSIVPSLRQLELGDNELTFFDVSNLPNLHTFHADRNRMVGMAGLNHARHLDSLSLREQHGEEPLDIGFLSTTAYEVRKLFLSGNLLKTFEPTVDFLNLQLLELANCGLQRLPENMGQLMPNLRTLNLNFNAISDLSPLRFIPRMKKLLAAGNRLSDSTTVTALLIDFPHLTQLDLRDNPVTLGFYPSLQVLVPRDCTAFVVDPFTLPEADVERDEMYAGRLDETTKLRRRLHHVVFATSCRRLRKLDGLPMDRQTVFCKDEVYQTLVAEGLLPDEKGIVGGDLDKSSLVTTKEAGEQWQSDVTRLA